MPRKSSDATDSAYESEHCVFFPTKLSISKVKALTLSEETQRDVMVVDARDFDKLAEYTLNLLARLVDEV